MHCLNKKNTIQKRAVKNPTFHNLNNLEVAEISLSQSVELDKVCFLSGSLTNSVHDSFNLLNSFKRCNIPSTMNHYSNILSTDEDIANSFNDFFISTFNDKTYDSNISTHTSDIAVEDLFDTLSVKSIFNTINAAEPSSAIVYDNFPSPLLKLCPNLFASLLFTLFSCIILTSTFPDQWKTAFVKPLHKQNSKMDIANYRPRSLLPKISIIFEKILYNFLYDRVKCKITPCQFGFQSKKSSVLQLIDFLKTVRNSNSPLLFSIYMDYVKAFDRVPFNILLSKLHKIGLDDNFVALIRSYLFGRRQIVIIRNQPSQPLKVKSGVPQGSVLGPLLFLLFINDMPSIFIDSIPWLFADDLNLLFQSLNFHDDLARLHSWNIANGMLANSAKSKSLVFCGTVLATINNERIENVNSHKDLGVYFQSDLKWTTHLKFKLSNALKAFHFLRNTVRWSTPSRVKLSLYSSTVLSIILYGSPVWLASFTFLKELESFQKKCFKWIFGSKLPYCDYLVKFRVLPICLLIELRTVSIFLDILDNKYNFDLSKFIVLQNLKSTSRRKMTNPLKVKTASHLQENSFFVRAVNSFNFLYRHGIINFNDTTNKRKVKKYLLSKQFIPELRCTYYLCCYCNVCKPCFSLS